MHVYKNKQQSRDGYQLPLDKVLLLILDCLDFVYLQNTASRTQLAHQKSSFKFLKFFKTKTYGAKPRLTKHTTAILTTASVTAATPLVTEEEEGHDINMEGIIQLSIDHSHNHAICRIF